MENIIQDPLCRICETRARGYLWNSEAGAATPKWTLTHVCCDCWEKVHRWDRATEASIKAAFPGNDKGAENAFWLTNRIRKTQNSRKRSQKTRQVAEGRRIKKGPRARYRPLLRQSEMRKLGVFV